MGLQPIRDFCVACSSEMRVQAATRGMPTVLTRCTVAHELLDWVAQQHDEPLKESNGIAEDGPQSVLGNLEAEGGMLRHDDARGCSRSRRSR